MNSQSRDDKLLTRPEEDAPSMDITVNTNVKNTNELKLESDKDELESEWFGPWFEEAWSEIAYRF